MKTTQEQRTELKRLAESVDGWKNCNKAWIDTSEDEACATVGHIDEDGEKYPLAFIDCNQYFSGDSMKVAKFYAAAMAAIPALLADLEEVQAELNALETWRHGILSTIRKLTEACLIFPTSPQIALQSITEAAADYRAFIDSQSKGGTACAK